MTGATSPSLLYFFGVMVRAARGGAAKGGVVCKHGASREQHATSRNRKIWGVGVVKELRSTPTPTAAVARGCAYFSVLQQYSGYFVILCCKKMPCKHVPGTGEQQTRVAARTFWVHHFSGKCIVLYLLLSHTHIRCCAKRKKKNSIMFPWALTAPAHTCRCSAEL